MHHSSSSRSAYGGSAPACSQVRAATCAANRVVIEDLHASIHHALGIPPKLAYEIEKRPFYVTRDGEGKPILDVFA